MAMSASVRIHGWFHTTPSAASIMSFSTTYPGFPTSNRAGSIATFAAACITAGEWMVFAATPAPEPRYTTATVASITPSTADPDHRARADGYTAVLVTTC